MIKDKMHSRYKNTNDKDIECAEERNLSCVVRFYAINISLCKSNFCIVIKTKSLLYIFFYVIG